jgi:hypothetical protein
MILRSLRVAGLCLLLPTIPAALGAQTDYYNTDAGRPVRTEDAYAIERRAMEFQVAPLRLERARGGAYRWGLEPEIAFGMLPRTQVEIGIPLVHVDGLAGRRTTAAAGVEVSALYNLNAETRLPALALAADVTLPVGGLAPSRAVPTLKAIATRTFPALRVHVNAAITFADAFDEVARMMPVNAELSRWSTGFAIDRTFPLQALLLTAEVVSSAPLARAEPQRWDMAGGARWQLSPRVAVDGGAGYRLAGDEPGWFMTTGAAVAIGMPWRNR